jgi:hypothetical protein
MTPTIKKYYRHFNAFLQDNGAKQIFWKNVQLEANRHKESYNIRKSKLLHGYNPKYWIMNAFNWDETEMQPAAWFRLHHLWENYCEEMY